MSRSKAELSITERYILTYISYKTNNGFKFFMNNETLAQIICCTIPSTKVLVNKLVREGYLIKTCDDRGRRQLSLSERKFMPLDGVNMGNIEKNTLKHDAQDQEQWANYYKNELNEAQNHIKSLENERNNYKNALETLMSVLATKGIDINDIEVMMR
ncbi:MAG: hypothetical protein IJZ59_00550 [Alphaproteobacteria bacterium]|nr:hypothetical protein [Alphaproteobacteria bacterium]